jgi:hypothetical protein
MATAKMKGSTFPRYEQNRFFPFPVSKESSLVASWARASVALGRTLGSEREEKKQIAWSRIVFVLKERERFIFQPKKGQSFSSRGGVCTLLSFFSFLFESVSSSSQKKAFVLCLNKQLTYYVFVSSFIKQLKTQVIIVRQPPRSPVLTEPATIERVFRPLDAGRG